MFTVIGLVNHLPWFIFEAANVISRLSGQPVCFKVLMSKTGQNLLYFEV